jgi:hypothetical protein
MLYMYEIFTNDNTIQRLENVPKTGKNSQETVINF